MSDPIRRQEYCEQVGIHGSTLSRWIKAGIVVPAKANCQSPQLFTKKDVQFGCALKSMLDKHRGKYSLQQMVEIIRGERKLSEIHSPPGSPAPFGSPEQSGQH
jgi:hypothetical protein